VSVRWIRVVSAALLAGPATACHSRDRPADRSRQTHTAQQGESSISSIALLALGDSLYGAAAYDSARRSYERAADGAGERGDSATVARALTSLGLVAWKQGRFDDAKSSGERALALKQRLALQGDLAKSFNALGLLAQNRGRLDEALSNFRDARAAAEAVHDSGYIAKARANLGLVYQGLGDFDRARVEMMASRDAAAAMGDRRTEANNLNNLGMLETRIGDPTRAIEWLDVARARYAAIDYAVGQENSLGQLGVAYAERGEPSRAFAYLDSALTIATKYGLREPEADDLELIAELYENAGDHVRALEFLRRARAVCDSLEMATKLGHVALAEARAYAALGNSQLARARAREAAERQHTAHAHMDELEADVFGAELAQRVGDSAAAAATLGAARRAADSLGRGTARITYALGVARVADLARRPRDVIGAQAAGQRDMSLLTAEEHAETEALRARAYFRLARYEEAADAGRRAVASLERIRGNLATGGQRASYTADRADIYADLVVTLLTTGRVDEAFRVADGARGRGLIEHLSTAGRGLPARGSARDVAAAESLLRRIDRLIERLRSSDSVRTPNSNRAPEPLAGGVVRELADARRDYEGLLDRVARSDPRSTILGVGRTDVGAVRRALATDEALLEFLSSSGRLVIFVVTRERVRWLDVPVGSSDLAERVHLARELIASRSAGADAPLADLYTKLIAPVESGDLLSGVSRLIIVPHASLTYLPFAALRATDATGRAHYLAERYSIVTLASASALSALRARGGDVLNSNATVIAPLPNELPFTRDEAVAVGAQLAHSHVVVGRAATEALLRDALRNSAIVHVASHGALNVESPMFSNLRLATSLSSTQRADDNGRLETFEVLSLDIRSHLVFLSGCETALGPAWSTTYSRGDDYATLAQAFLFSGARNVVATLWTINDRGAADFARTFYEALASSTPSVALASAQRAFINNPSYAAPYYWAAYTLSGSGLLTPGASN
jgi:CHAT domain-containing protein/Tfp pilus assembly protein PilF